jgi:hypothetical protein
MLNAKERMDNEPVGGGEISKVTSIPEMIARLDELRQKGILTDEEFQQKKSELLAKL